MAIRIEFLSSWRGISNTHRDTPGEDCSGHLWYNSGITGSTDAASPRATLCQDDMDFNPLGLTPISPSTFLLPPRCDLPFDSRPKLYYSASRSERLIRPTKCSTVFNITQERIANRSLNDSDEDRSTPKTSMPCCFTIVIMFGLISFY
jgi:hypothetical protein